MATLYKTDEAAQGIGRKTLYLDCRVVTYAAPVLIDADVIEMVPIFAGETVVSVEVLVTDLDTGSPAMVFDVGDGDLVDRYIDGSTAAQAGGLAKHTQGCPFSYSEADTIDFLVDVVAATSVIGTIVMTVLVK